MEFYIILAQTPVGVSVFAVSADRAGVSRYEGNNSAIFGLLNGPHMNIVFDNVCVPADHLIGVEGKGVRQAVSVLNYSRTLAGTVSLGIARAAFEQAFAFARNRQAFKQQVIEFQGIQWYFSDMLTEIDAARLLVYRAARALNVDEQIPRLVARRSTRRRRWRPRSRAFQRRFAARTGSCRTHRSAAICATPRRMRWQADRRRF